MFKYGVRFLRWDISIAVSKSDHIHLLAIKRHAIGNHRKTWLIQDGDSHEIRTMAAAVACLDWISSRFLMTLVNLDAFLSCRANTRPEVGILWGSVLEMDDTDLLSRISPLCPPFFVATPGFLAFAGSAWSGHEPPACLLILSCQEQIKPGHKECRRKWTQPASWLIG